MKIINVLPLSCPSGLTRLFTALCVISLVPRPVLGSSFLAPGDGANSQRAALALGLTPEAMACIDVHGSEAETVFVRLADEYSTFTQLESLKQQILDQQQIVRDAQSELRDVAGDQSAITALNNAQAQIAQLNALAQSTREGLLATVLVDLADDSMIADVITTDRIFAVLPPAYRLAVTTPDEASELAWALKMQARAQANETDVNNNADLIIQQAESQYDVQVALSRADSYTAINEQTIQQWILAN